MGHPDDDDGGRLDPFLGFDRSRRARPGSIRFRVRSEGAQGAISALGTRRRTIGIEVVFLDIDGVLNSAGVVRPPGERRPHGLRPVRRGGLAHDARSGLRRAPRPSVAAHDAKVVISSSWRQLTRAVHHRAPPSRAARLPRRGHQRHDDEQRPHAHAQDAAGRSIAHWLATASVEGDV